MLVSVAVTPSGAVPSCIEQRKTDISSLFYDCPWSLTSAMEQLEHAEQSLVAERVYHDPQA